MTKPICSLCDFYFVNTAVRVAPGNWAPLCRACAERASNGLQAEGDVDAVVLREPASQAAYDRARAGRISASDALAFARSIESGLQTRVVEQMYRDGRLGLRSATV